jgi:hypothetical protein
MTFSDRLKDVLEKGVEASKEFAIKAGAKAQDLGERGVLMLEIRQLEGQAQKLAGRLGTEVYEAFAERGETSVSAETPAINALLADITAVKEKIERKDLELKSR